MAGVKAQMRRLNRRSQASQAQVETIRAQLENARWNLTQTTVVAPADGTMVNVMLRPGFFAGMPFNEVMTFVDTQYQIFACSTRTNCTRSLRGTKRDYPRHLAGAHRQGARGFGDLGASSGELDASGELARPPSSHLRAASR